MADGEHLFQKAITETGKAFVLAFEKHPPDRALLLILGFILSVGESAMQEYKARTQEYIYSDEFMEKVKGDIEIESRTRK